ncbi:bifunctional 4-hydroxy-2-oxoglutarate aldolase/2-dehydro-3-deoxy-phosphogluconate aldolase [Gammaproteobacteria bacterium]|nr:bifunctional 4-hydroxy-2-oxoglutarate aldolase/2-dehydro-3-deoxy-phosphogluconate aldolase [Gammaproteobacteria bacterium]MDA9341016.1 bifunctional 4-hydroxy-2-oxoglutarate aldolase/2-dehydro-3-deoxy-phosphogluconate aldolase [Gammaproteobacteria bacterium]MDC0091404.1 bifunctional 4-hydroxy-2-oxoglutarate aldolase/2-dehydro-3-deoxy-phosphogluconate aldolase [Gammaproteobacteria bacterium]MDC1326196.1 bifunctional 4-hydroxy-2-oxoglutarate aldolase/2-dehydro-3-deoxy-phosphogluconate aldolase [
MTNKNKKIPRTLPTLTLSSIEEAKKVFAVLQAANINSIEVTLRPSVSDDAIEFLSNQSEINLGLGTVLSLTQLLKFKNLNISYVVSPGFNEEVHNYCRLEEITYIPGVETASEVMRMMSFGLNQLKFFPAEQSGGTEKLKAFYAVFPSITFLCTGGIDLNNYKQYVELPNVFAVGGSFVLPKEFLNTDDTERAIEYLRML